MPSVACQEEWCSLASQRSSVVGALEHSISIRFTLSFAASACGGIHPSLFGKDGSAPAASSNRTTSTLVYKLVQVAMSGVSPLLSVLASARPRCSKLTMSTFPLLAAICRARLPGTVQTTYGPGHGTLTVTGLLECALFPGKTLTMSALLAMVAATMDA